MKTLQLPFFIFCYFLFSASCFGQIKSMGFSQKIEESSFFPKLQVINDTLFVCSNTGIFQKDMVRDSEWELFAFKDIKIIEFVKNGNQLLSISQGTKDGKDSQMFFSENNGKTFQNFTFPDLFGEKEDNFPFRIIQNPQNLNSLLFSHAHSGLSKSQDFGKSWRNLNEISGSTQNSYLGFHALDTTTIYYSTFTLISGGNILRSTDDGLNWSFYSSSLEYANVNHITFHPLNQDVLIFSDYGAFGKSSDKGKTWKMINLYDLKLFFYRVFFDKKNPEILYASGIYRSGNNKQVYIYYSTDTGENWRLAYTEILDTDYGNIIDMVLYKNRLIYYTTEGLFEINMETTPWLSNPKITIVPELTISQNPIDNTLHFDTELNIKCIEIMDMAGRVVQQNIISDNERFIDVSGLVTGVYLAVFYANGQKKCKKICINR